MAAFLASGYSAAEIKTLILETSFASFLQRAPMFRLKWIGPMARLLWKKGLYSGEVLEQWVHKCLLKKGIRTFGDLKPGQLRIIASDISNGRLLVLPDDIAHYGIDPNTFYVSKAIRMSTSIPYFFDPVVIPQLQKGSDLTFSEQPTYVVDGGLLSNFPLWLFDNEIEPQTKRLVPTMGFQLVGKQDNQPHRISGLITMFHSMFETMLSAHDQRYIDEVNRFRTIHIPTLGISPIEFHLRMEQSIALYDSGVKSGDAFFKQWTYEEYERMCSFYQKSGAE